MVEWFNNLTDASKIAIAAIAVPVIVVVIGGIIKLLRKKDGHSPQNIKINTGIDPNNLVYLFGKTKEELGQANERIKQLEEQLAKPSLETSIASEQSTTVPSMEAKELANLITEDDGLYAQALKAIAEGDNEKADRLLDETQQFLDTVQQRKDEAQAKIYMARMQNASYAGRPQDALQYCDKLSTLAGNDSLIINEMAKIYYENAKYKEAEPLMKRVVEILENPGGEPLPNYAGALNNLAQLYKATNRLKEAEPLMKRALKIDEASLGKDHPKVAIRLNNLAALYQATNRLKEAEPLMERHLVIFLQFTRRTGHPHPHLNAAINNYSGLLMQMGHSRNEVNDHLKRLAPEMFESTDKHVKKE